MRLGSAALARCSTFGKRSGAKSYWSGAQRYRLADWATIRGLVGGAEDDDTVIARNTDKPLPHSEMSICRFDLYATLDDKSHIAVCGFYAKRYGHYVAKVSTIDTLSAFKGIATAIRVNQFYNTGE